MDGPLIVLVPVPITLVQQYNRALNSTSTSSNSTSTAIQQDTNSTSTSSNNSCTRIQ